ncbi:nucleoside hydrolase-like domain-containing protein [Niastella populi]|uniref:Cellulose-binding Sde182 nucleoside hydrolase-like domain-containing protein n=1 Tax=Niastella populi TaxID=550983 RepID=A0A1V9FKQ3_9BACT|nr:nucleoside hydrolase-like domain-containing protein [Niastella populi]OQP58928.1 hypothetical protein A4R26_22375 [Niastella populi]
MGIVQKGPAVWRDPFLKRYNDRRIAQAIWKVKQSRSKKQLNKFLGKLRIFMIGLGSQTGQDGSGQWLPDNFPELFIIVSQKTYGGMFAQNPPVGNLEWLNKNIRERHGPAILSSHGKHWIAGMLVRDHKSLCF